MYVCMDTYNGMIVDFVVGEMVGADWVRDKRSSDDAKHELDLAVPAAGNGGFTVRFNPGFHVLWRRIHFVRDRNFKNRFKPIHSIQIGAQSPHHAISKNTETHGGESKKKIQMETGFIWMID